MTAITEEQKIPEKKLTLKNYQLKLLVSWCDVPLHGKESRARNRFLALCEDHFIDIEKRRIDILKDVAPKDENGNPKLKDDGKTFDLDESGVEKFKERISSLNSEEFSISPNHDGRKDLKAMKEFVVDRLGDIREFNAFEGQVYDEICTAFENAL